MKYKLDLTKLLTWILALFAASTIAYNFSGQVYLHLAATLGFALILYWLYSNFSSKHKSIWTTMITGLLIFLILDPGSEPIHLLVPLIATFLAITLKFFVEYKGSPMVNPAAAGILLTAAIAAIIPNFGPAETSWWGTNFQQVIPFALLIVWLILGLYKLKKLPLVATFLLTHFIVLYLRGANMEAMTLIFGSPEIYFLAGILLIDPKTSPLKVRQEVYYGLVAALFLNIFIQYEVHHAGLFAVVAANFSNVLLNPKK